MQLAMIGLGRMGGNMAQRLVQGGHELIVYDSSADAIKPHVGKGAKGAKDLADVARLLTPRRVVWIMVPAGAVERSLEQLAPHLSRGDIVIDGGNSNYRDSLRRAETLEKQGIEFIDVGTSGGIWGLTLGYCLRIGASTDAVEDSGEGRWTVEEAMRLDVAAPVITLSLLARLRSRQEESFGAKVIAALRNEFGGHAVQTR